LVRQRIRLQMQ